MKTQAICTGSAHTEDRAIEWLKAHGAIVESTHAVTVIILPENARVERSSDYWRSSITFPPDHEEGSYVEVEHYVDAYETILTLHEAPTYEPEPDSPLLDFHPWS